MAEGAEDKRKDSCRDTVDEVVAANSGARRSDYRSELVACLIDNAVRTPYIEFNG